MSRSKLKLPNIGNYNTSSARGRYLPDGSLNVAGRWKSPGPKYALPSSIGTFNHNVTIETKPAFTFGTKTNGSAEENCSPGPVYYPDSKLSRTGKNNAPFYSLSGRSKAYSLWYGPGPGAYAPEKHLNSTKKCMPAYTIAGKHKHLETPIHSVGPNQYRLGNTIGNINFNAKIKTAPAFSLSSRSKFMSTTYHMNESSQQYYKPGVDVIKKKSPAWSMTARNYPPSIANCKPGPGDYRSELVKIHLPDSPKITMGIRHSELCSTGLRSDCHVE